MSSDKTKCENIINNYGQRNQGFREIPEIKSTDSIKVKLQQNCDLNQL